MTTTATLPNVTLYYKDGKSDKVYQCNIEQSEDGYLVNFAYGRRGGTLKAGTKTKTPVTLEKAKKAFDSLVNSKTSKGYTEGEGGSSYTPVNKEKTTLIPQLLNIIPEDQALKLLEDDDYIAQEKKDGERMILSCGKTPIAANKLGMRKSISDLIAKASEPFEGYALDGEAIGDTLYVFDCLETPRGCIRDLSVMKRYDLLSILSEEFSDNIQIVPMAITTQQKKKLFNSLQKNEREGIVFKKKDSKYIAGRPASGGNQLKFKFYATASCRVRTENETKNSVEVELLEDDKWISVGNITIPTNKEKPSVGDIIEVKYLYAYKGGSLFQTVYLNKRTDVEDSECTIEQLKYKST